MKPKALPGSEDTWTNEVGEDELVDDVLKKLRELKCRIDEGTINLYSKEMARIRVMTKQFLELQETQRKEPTRKRRSS
ncbi:MAG: hypothetical protein ACE5JQ_00805 [Candidatus Methylomirabilales bacterium]